MTETNRTNTDFSFEIVEHIVTLGTYQTGWSKEVNLVAWNKANPKVDVRDWSADHTKMSRGITLTEAEAEKMAQAIGQRMLDRQRDSKVQDAFER